jgi:hypothetical protein
MQAADGARFWRGVAWLHRKASNDYGYIMHENDPLDLFSEASPAMMHHGAAVLEFAHD